MPHQQRCTRTQRRRTCAFQCVVMGSTWGLFVTVAKICRCRCEVQDFRYALL